MTHSILLVEDEYAGAEVLAQILRDEGYRVTVAGNGRQAMERLREAAPDLVITDFMMPLMNGLEMARALREVPQHGSTRVLLMSGVSRSMIPGCDGDYDRYLRKPFGAQEFLAVVRSLLDPGS